MIPRVMTAGRKYFGGLSPDARAGLFGLGWSYLTHALLIVLKIGSSLILTRLLLPEAYGVFGPALAAMFFLEFLSDIGLRPAIVRSSNGDRPEFLGTAWTIVLGRAVVLSLVALGLSRLLPAWYDLPDLAAVLAVLAVRPMLLAVQNPTLYVLFRRLNYRTSFFLDVAQSLAAVPFTILMSWWLQNVWGLVFGLLFGDVVRIVLTHLLCPRPPRPCWHRSAVTELSHFGVSIFFNTLVFGVWVYFDRLIGPKLLRADEMGLYITAWGLAEALDNLIGRGCDVFYAMLSRQTDGDARRAFFETTARRVAFYLGPALAAAAIAAPWLFRFLYAPPFHGAAVLLGLLTARMILRATSQVQFMELMVTGEIILATRSYVASLVVLAATFVPLVREYGVRGVAISAVLAMTTFTLVQTAMMVRRGLARPLPVVLGLAWTAAAIAGVLLAGGE